MHLAMNLNSVLTFIIKTELNYLNHFIFCPGLFRIISAILIERLLNNIQMTSRTTYTHRFAMNESNESNSFLRIFLIRYYGKEERGHKAR